MSREFIMGIRLNYYDNSFTRGMREAQRQTNRFREGMAAATRSAEGFSASLGAAAVALGGLAAAKKGFDWLVGANADMEQYQNTLAVVLKSQEEAVKTLAWANKFAAQTPFEIPQIVEATTRMQAYGISAQKTLGIVGDMASVMGKDLMQAVEAIADAQTGELERLKEFGITKKMIQEQAKLLGTNPVNNQGSITDQKAFNAALFSLMEDRFKGGMEMQSRTFKGMLSNAKDFMGSLGRQLGQPLFERSKRQLESFLDTLNRLQSDGSINRWVKQVQNAGADVGRVFQSAYRVAVAVFRGIWAVVGPIIDGIKRNWATWGPIIETVGYSLAVFATGLGAVKTALGAASLAMRLLNAAMLTNPIGWVLLGIGLLIGAFIKLNGGIEGTKKVLAGWFNQAKTYWKSDQIQGWVSKVVTAFNWLVQKAGEVIAWIRTNWPQIQAAIVGAFMKVWAIVGPVVTQIVANIVSAFSAVYNWFMQYWPGIQRFFILFWAWVGPYVMAAFKILWSVISNGFTLIWNIVQNVWNMIAGVIQVAWGIISGILGVGLALLVGDWGGAWEAMLGMLRNVWDGLGKFFSGVGKLFYDSGKAIIKTLVDGIKSVADAPVKAVKNVLDKVREFLPFSDAKRGPLSELTYSGGAIMTTLGEGVWKKASILSKSISGAFSDSGVNITPNRVMATAPAAPTVAAAAPTLQFGDIHIQTSEGTDTVALAREVIDQLYRQVKEAAANLSSVDKTALI